MHSINTRLLLVASLILVSFLGLTGITLEGAFRQSTQTAIQDRLQAYIYILIGAADVDEQGQMRMPEELAEARFSNPSSGLYAQISSNSSNYVWTSPSLVGTKIPFLTGLNAAEMHFNKLLNNNNEYYTLSFGFSWEIDASKSADFTINVAEDLSGFHAQLSSYRRSLWGWLVAVTVMLLIVQVWILRWGLTPLRQVANDLEDIEAGKRQELAGTYPTELHGLTKNINRLIINERANLKRYRDTLGDLAHSLKTPLSVLRSVVDNKPDRQELEQTVGEQIERMTHIVNYQLQRAVASGHVTFATPLSVNALVDRVLNSLNKVYCDKTIKLETKIESQLSYQGEEGDLLEIFGNLLDNAHKWCKSTIKLEVKTLLNTQNNISGIALYVADDGPGIAQTQVEDVLKRGVRADTRVEGHGIGLSIVHNIVQSYAGEINITTSDLGGALIQINLPGR